MAAYYDANSAETVKLWSKRLWSEHRVADSVFNPKLGLTGDDPDTNAFVLIDNMQKTEGDEVTIPIVLELDGATTRGTIGDEILEGKEAEITTSTMKMKIDEARIGVRTRGRMNNQRVTFDTFEVSKKKLSNLWKQRRAVCAINHLCGNTTQTDLAYTGLNTVQAADSQHIYRVNQGLGASDDQTVKADTTAKFDVNVIDELVTIAEQVTVPIAPFMLGGNPYYGMFVHPNQIRDLRNKSSQHYAAMLAALQGGRIDGNPLFTRAIGMWRNVLLFSEPYLTQGIHSSTGAYQSDTRRAVFFGAGALAIAYGRHDSGSKEHFRWYSGSWDHGAKYYASASMIWGVKAPRYTIAGTARDYGKIVVTTYAKEAISGAGNKGQ